MTSFLKEQGIRPRNVNRFTSLRQQERSSADRLAIPEETDGSENDDRDDSEPDSDNLDDHPPSKNHKQNQIRSNQPVSQTNPSSSSNVPVSNPVASTSSIKKKDRSEDPELKPKPGKYADRKPGLITTCVECGKRFTVTRYTIHSSNRTGQLCDGCAQEAKDDGRSSNSKNPKGSFASPIKKRKTTKNQIIKQPWSEASIQTLQMACITTIARNMDSIEALGNVGSVNLEKICQIVCKHRQLTPSNLRLFVDAAYSDLKLFDCIHLRDSHLKNIPSFCPHLEKLTLNLCGHMTGEVLETYAERLPKLRELELFGAYLIRKESWLKALEIWTKPRTIQRIPSNDEDKMSVDADDGEGCAVEQVELVQAPQIAGFRLKQSPRFDLDCVRSLVGSCKNLTSLHLNDIGLLDHQALDLIAQAGLHQLKDLAISNAGIKNGATGEALTDDAFNRCLAAVGSTIERLDISQNKNLTDSVLNDGVGSHCLRLTSLNLNGLKEITTAGVQNLFTKLKEAERPGLIYLNLSRCIKVGNEALFSILDHSAKTLTTLDLNSVDELRTEALERLAAETRNLESLDVSFVRDVDDFIIKAFLDHMINLKSISVYGNNRVSDLCPSRKGVTIKGQERAIVVN